MTRRASRLDKCFKETSRNPPNKKNQFVAIRAIRGLCGIGVLNKRLFLIFFLTIMQGMINCTNTLFNILVIDFVKLCKSSNTILVREDDKPWYDSKILRKSWKRGRIKTEDRRNR